MGRWFGVDLDRSRPMTRQIGARAGLIILSSINLLNFADRYVPSAVKQLIEDDLHLNDFQTALPVTGMIVVYMIFAVIFGILSDRELFDRRVLLFGAIISWSIATASAGLATNLTQLIVFRSLVGIGEAAYGTIAPPMIADYYPHSERNVAFGIYYLAIPIGGAVGFGVGALLGSAFGWRVAFFGCGFPGILAALFVLRIANPSRGINDDETVDIDSPLLINVAENVPSKIESSSSPPPSNESSLIAELYEILSNPHFLWAMLGLAMNNFALGGLADWYATFLLRYCDVSLDTAGLAVGAATVIGGLGGTVLGSKVADHFKTKVKSSYFLIPALFTIPATAFLLLAVNYTQSAAVTIVFVFIGEIFVWTNVAPINAVSISVIPPKLRARSAGVCIFCQHILGDVISPPIIGAISDATGSLKFAIQITWIAVAVSGVCWWVGYFFLKPLDTNSDVNEFGENAHTDQTKATYCNLLCGSDVDINDSA